MNNEIGRTERQRPRTGCVGTATPLGLLIVLFLAYAAIFVPVDQFRHQGFDPLAPRPRIVERLISTRQFAQALPLALELRAGFPNEPEIIVWLATIHHGLQDDRSEAGAWEDYLRVSKTSSATCPALPEAYTRLGDALKAVTAYVRCLKEAPQDPDRMADLAAAYERTGRIAEAVDLYREAAALDPYNPAVIKRLASLGEGRP